MAEERRNALAPGTELEGYRIDSILGAGGFGVTYLATEILLNRSVAIKEFLPAGMVVRDPDGLNIAPIGTTEAGDFEWGMDRFRQEAQTLVAFRHTNIVSVLRYFETNGTGYLVMEFVEGRTLAQLLRPDVVLDEDEIREILDPLLNGLEAVHEKGFLHRDIKPANIFIREDGSPVLIDFGAARMAMGHHSKSLTSIISAGYAPYEQYDSSASQGAWTDIYALGGVLYRSVTGTLPTEAPARITAVFGGGEDPMAPAKLAAKSECSDALIAAIDSALGIREGDRPQTVAAFRELLKGDAAAEEGEAVKTAIAAADISKVTDQPTLLAGGPASAAPARSATAPAAAHPATSSPAVSVGVASAKGSKWKVAVPIALVLLGAAGAGAWGLFGDHGESQACLQIAKQADVAIGRSDLAAARQQLGAARTVGCSKEMIAGLNSKVQSLAAKLAADAERKREEAARRKKEAAERAFRLLREKPPEILWKTELGDDHRNHLKKIFLLPNDDVLVAGNWHTKLLPKGPHKKFNYWRDSSIWFARINGNGSIVSQQRHQLKKQETKALAFERAPNNKIAVVAKANVSSSKKWPKKYWSLNFDFNGRQTGNGSEFITDVEKRYRISNATLADGEWYILSAEKKTREISSPLAWYGYYGLKLTNRRLLNKAEFFDAHIVNNTFSKNKKLTIISSITKFEEETNFISIHVSKIDAFKNSTDWEYTYHFRETTIPYSSLRLRDSSYKIFYLSGKNRVPVEISKATLPDIYFGSLHLDSNGRQIGRHEYPLAKAIKPWSAIRLDSGHTLIGGELSVEKGEDVLWGAGLVLLDAGGSIVWRKFYSTELVGFSRLKVGKSGEIYALSQKKSAESVDVGRWYLVRLGYAP